MSVPMSVDSLTEALVRRGVLAAGTGSMPVPTLDRPWFISVVLGFAGWLAGIFALVFVGLLFQPDSVPGLSFTGLIMLAAAYGLYAIDRESAFFDQLALALSI